MTSTIRTATMTAFLLGLAACADPVPDAPTWFADVQPILNANCARCHGATPETDQIAAFRLDRYVKDDASTLDAYDYRDSIVARAVALQTPVMPPRGELSDRQRAILDAWVLAGAPKGARTNELPTAGLVAPDPLPAQVDQELAVTIETADADGDGLVVSLAARDLTTGEMWVVPAVLGGGMHDVAVDTGQMASTHDYELSVVIDDGFSDSPEENQYSIVVVASVRVDHGARGTAPTVRVLEPDGGQAIIGETTIAWSATDPDPGDSLTIDVDLVRVAADGTGTVVASIARGLTGTSSFAWTPTGLPIDQNGTPILYKVRVTATDAGALNTRFDESDTSFTIAPQSTPTSLTWADVKPIFVTYCKQCHGEPARTMALEYFRLDKYDASDPEPPATTDQGAFEVRSLVYQRLVSAQNMPPAAQPKPTAAERAMVGEWILGGAPEGTGPSDTPPTFTWTTPNDGAVTRTSTGMVSLAWSTSDPEGMTLAGQIEFTRLTANSDQTAFCDVPLTGWTMLTANVTAGSFGWTVPSTGYFCLRGTVSDPGGNTTARVARRPVRYSTTPGL